MALIAALLGLGLAIPSGQPAVSIELPARAAVAPGPLKLADIAKLTGDSKLVERFAAVSLGTAPLPGHCRRLAVGWLRLRLRAAGLDPDIAQFSGSQAVVVYVPPTQPADAQARAEVPARPGQKTPPAQPAVRRGQTVSVIARRGLVTVRTLGRALEDGLKGQFIQVEIKHTHRRVLAKIVGPRCVEVSP